MADRNELLMQIMQCGFILVDINLYLDTHPHDEQALLYFNCYAQQLAVLKQRYVENFGPIENFGGSTSEEYWKWAEQSFPWDAGHMEG